MILAFVLSADFLTAPIAQLVERPLSEQEVVPHHTKGVKMVLAAPLLTLA